MHRRIARVSQENETHKDVPAASRTWLPHQVFFCVYEALEIPTRINVC